MYRCVWPVVLGIPGINAALANVRMSRRDTMNEEEWKELKEASWQTYQGLERSDPSFLDHVASAAVRSDIKCCARLVDLATGLLVSVESEENTATSASNPQDMDNSQDGLLRAFHLLETDQISLEEASGSVHHHSQALGRLQTQSLSRAAANGTGAQSWVRRIGLI